MAGLHNCLLKVMQLAGVQCTICRQNVLFETDGTWCASCKGIFHRRCLVKASSVCPNCKGAFVPPDGDFVFSEFCPECMKRNAPPQPHCATCHARTRWDSKAEYDHFLEEVKDEARVRFLRAMLEFAGSALCGCTFLLLLSLGPPGVSTLIAGLGSIMLAADGVFSMLRSRTMNRFK